MSLFALITCLTLGIVNFGRWYLTDTTFGLWASGFCFGLAVAIITERLAR